MTVVLIREFGALWRECDSFCVQDLVPPARARMSTFVCTKVAENYVNTKYTKESQQRKKESFH